MCWWQGFCPGFLLTPPHLIIAAGGLPDSWLGGNKVLKTVRYLDLSNNFLGYAGISSANTTSGVVGTGQYANRLAWCHTPAELTNEGWCPTATAPLTGTLDSLEMFDISNNGFVGELQPARCAPPVPRPPCSTAPPSNAKRRCCPAPVWHPSFGCRHGWEVCCCCTAFPCCCMLCGGVVVCPLLLVVPRWPQALCCWVPTVQVSCPPSGPS